MGVTDLHCNAQNYAKIEHVIDALCIQNDTVILGLNGDITTKFDANSGNPVTVSAGDGHLDRSKQLTASLTGLLSRYSNLYVIFNMGNHELMGSHPHLISCFLQIMTQAGSGRFHTISNIKMLTPQEDMKSHEPQNGLKDFVKPHVTIDGITIVGYCTPNIFPDVKPENQELYKYALGNFFANVGGSRHIDNFVENFNSAMSQGGLAMVVLAHEGAPEFKRCVWSRFGLRITSLPRLIIGVFGHDHGKTHANGVEISGMSVVQPKPFGNDVAVIKLQGQRIVSLGYSS
ncbi:MAG: metallophosphoesterase [Puniceicoccales bacterium]|nr:metallophosphoesterase [Puniceicoccales bacterium]